MALVDTAPASQVLPAPPVFWMLLPLTVTFTVLLHPTASHIPVGSSCGVLASALLPAAPSWSHASKKNTRSRTPAMSFLLICMGGTPSHCRGGGWWMRHVARMGRTAAKHLERGCGPGHQAMVMNT